MQSFDVNNLLNGILSNTVFAFCCWLAKKFSKDLEKRSPVYRKVLLVALAILWVSLHIFFYFSLTGFRFLFASILSFVVAAYFAWNELDQFWQLGLIGADREISDGIDFKRSLDLCSNSLEFLGIGASKLTRQNNFDEVMGRCHRSHTPIKFLLCDPNNPELQRIAMQAGRDPGEYQRTVRESLRIVAQQKKFRARNIEVRFYQRLPLFRLMFIDEWLCLASPYVFGEGEGGQWPQLHVRRMPSQRDVESLYEPFRRYFQELWRESADWDFISHLE